ncbi:hypothetical protein BDZ97DRAFT_378710 [Flammula alnicola]|nr:hypothetical protein BDZ97DRAFT_378710 [Flammula alnicola]
MSFNIGMAMLQPKEASESSSISAPRIFLPPGTPDHEKEFDPYDPIHLEKGHSRTPSPLVVAYAASPESSREPSRAPSREPSRELSPLRVTNPEPTTSAQKPERTNNRDRQAPPTQQGTRIDDPPPYNNTILIEDERLPTSHFRAPPQTQTSSRSTSPERAPSRKSNDVASSDQSHQSRQGSVTMPTDSMRDIPTMAQNKREVSDSRQPRPALVSTQNNSVEKVQPMAHDQRSVAQDKQAVAPMLPARRSRERLPPPTLSSSERDRDARSTHQSISTHSSGQTRNGPPPPHRRVPKHLVMPAPLNNGGGLNGFASPPPRMYPLPSGQLPPRHAQVTFQPQMQTYYPRPVSPPGFKPPILATQQAQEIHIATSRKLKKRMSMVTPSSVANIPPAPIISTVSFAPPVIGYGHHPSDEKGLSRAKTEKIEKIPKRVLSKRRTNI